jgi:radical SAM protein with 4Fe4S-binding SPASM domain
LQYPREIVDEYVRQGFHSIFLRPISPYGFAVRTENRNGYNEHQFLSFYKNALAYILDLNRQGTLLCETFAKILLTKILTPYATGYVDLQSPAGAGISVLVYNYNGDLYASDESRMLAEMNDQTFRLGNVHRDNFASVVRSEAFEYLASAACNETLPGCADCAYQLYCGADPVFHHRTQADAFGHRPTSAFCARNMAIITHLFRLLRDGDQDLHRIFHGWVRDEVPKQLGVTCD